MVSERKKEERFQEFQRRGFDKLFKVDRELFFGGMFGLDQMLINITTKGFKNSRVSVVEDKLEYLKGLWYFSVMDEDKKIIEYQKYWGKVKAESDAATSERRSSAMVLFFLVVVFPVSVALAMYGCWPENSNYNHPACEKLGLQSNWNETKCY